MLPTKCVKSIIASCQSSNAFKLTHPYSILYLRPCHPFNRPGMSDRMLPAMYDLLIVGGGVVGSYLAGEMADIAAMTGVEIDHADSRIQSFV